MKHCVSSKTGEDSGYFKSCSLSLATFVSWFFFFSLSLSRLVEDDERKWTDENVNNVALKHFPNIDRNAALVRPILFSNWLSKDYMPVEQEELRDFVKARLKVWVNQSDFCDIFVIIWTTDHLRFLCIERVLLQPPVQTLVGFVTQSLPPPRKEDAWWAWRPASYIIGG